MQTMVRARAVRVSERRRAGRLERLVMWWAERVAWLRPPVELR
jgi:hypothetical protein